MSVGAQFKAGGFLDQFRKRVLHRHQPGRSGRTIKDHVKPIFLPAVRRRRPFIRADIDVPSPGTALDLNASARAFRPMA